MKIVFINNAMTHYYNLVLSRLNREPGVDLTLVFPGGHSANIGDGVHQTTDGADFRVCVLEEYTRFGVYSFFRGLGGFLLKEKPDVVIMADLYILGMLFNIPVRLIMKFLNIRLIMKSIPFRLQRYDDAKKEICEGSATPPLGTGFLSILGRSKLVCLAKLKLRKHAYNLPDAHVNYVDEAFDIYGSFGVASDKIFITRNSPDTDKLFAVREDLHTVEPILPPCSHRLVHVGRLVEWKRVDLLLKAFSRVKEEFDDAELLIIGSGPEEQKLKELSEKLGLISGVRFLGGVHDPAHLGAYLMSSTIYVLAGMGGLSINDAMCFGLPVICSVCDGTEKVLVRDGYNGNFFRDGDEDDLVAKILNLFRNPSLVARMGENSTGIIRNEVNIQTVINGYMDAIKYVLKDQCKKPAGNRS